jgi:hypothetical protein
MKLNNKYQHLTERSARIPVYKYSVTRQVYIRQKVSLTKNTCIEEMQETFNFQQKSP